MKLLYITTVGQTMGFFTSLITELIREGHKIDIACSDTERIPAQYADLGCEVFPLSCSRNPLALGNIRSIREIRRIVEEGKYDAVHCHTPIAAALARIACRPLRKRGLKVIYTAHGFHFYKGAPLVNWLLYYPIEWVCARWTDLLLTMNREDYEFAARRLKAGDVKYVPGVGVDTERFAKVESDRAAKRGELCLGDGDIVLLSVGELNRGKNHQAIFRALAELKDPRIRYLVAGRGKQEASLRAIAESLGIAEQVRLTGHRDDIPELLNAADIFCFPSIREGLPVALMEAMASGLPCVASGIRGITDLINDGEGGFLCRPNDTQCFAAAIERLVESPSLRKTMGLVNSDRVKAFDQKRVNGIMKEIYENAV